MVSVGSSSQGGGHFDFLSDKEETKEEKQPDVEEETDEEYKPFIEFIDCCRPRGEHYDDGILHHASVSVDVDSVVAFAAKGDGILRALPEEANFSMRTLMSRTHKAHSSRVLVKLNHTDSRRPKRRGVLPGSVLIFYQTKRKQRKKNSQMLKKKQMKKISHSLNL
jgi:hypothetical protein